MCTQRRDLPAWALLVLLTGCDEPNPAPDDASDTAADVANVAVRLDFSTIVAEVDERYLSFTVDTARVARPLDQTYNFDRPPLQRMAAELLPAYFRIGGTAADTTYYDLSDAPPEVPPTVDERVLTRAVWDGACDFAVELGVEMLFTLNAGPGPRDENGRWTPDNARALISYSVDRDCPVAVWELGNEVNAFPVIFGFDAQLEGADYALDMAAARELLDEVAPDALLAGPASAYWPVAGEIIPLLPEFLENGGQWVDLVTWHYYPQQSSNCPVATRLAEEGTLLEPANLDELNVWADEVEGAAAQYAPQASVWLGETSHAQCGGEENLSDRYVTGFWWLDQLGRVARRGEPVMFRQTLTGGSYSLIDDATLVPRPDYFTSVLWKRLMGTQVLGAQVETMSDFDATRLRAYAHCSRGGDGAVTLALINLDPGQAAVIALPDVADQAREVYLLTAEALTSSEMALNGEVLVAGTDGSLPPMTAVVEAGVVTVPALSYGFVALPGADASICR